MRSKYQLEAIQQLKVKAYTLYKTGLTTRQVGKVLERSHEWVAQAVRAFDKEVQSRV